MYILHALYVYSNPKPANKLSWISMSNLESYPSFSYKRIFKIKPFLIPISAKLALQAKESSNPELYSRSGLGKLEEYIFNTLGEEERIKMKIKSSSELALNLCAETEKVLESHLDKISVDMERLGEFETRLEGMKQEVFENSKQFTKMEPILGV